jgi:hypothetical protein
MHFSTACPMPSGSPQDARRSLSATPCAAIFQFYANDAVIELLIDLKHYCAARRIDFEACIGTADDRFVAAMKGGAR